MPRNPNQSSEQYSDEVHEILSYVPNWIIQWGISIVFLSILMLLALSWYIKYPDVVTGEITLTAHTAPASVVARNSGALTLFVEDNIEVIEDEIVAMLSNAARYEHILELKEGLKLLKPKLNSEWAIASRYLKNSWELGELQPYYNKLVNSYKEKDIIGSVADNNESRKKILQGKIAEKEEEARLVKLEIRLLGNTKPVLRKKEREETKSKKEILQKQMIEYDAINAKLKKQLRILEEEYEKSYDVYHNEFKPLFEKEEISKIELEKQRERMQQKAMAAEDARNSIDRNQNYVLDLKRQAVEIDERDKLDMERKLEEREKEERNEDRAQIQLETRLKENAAQILDLKSQMQELDFSYKKTSKRSSNSIENNYSIIVNQILLWEEKYLISAPISGKINYIDFTKNKSFVKKEQEIAKVVPPPSEAKIFGELLIKEQGSGKVTVGQDVNIEIDSYEQEDFGFLRGKVQTISNVSNNNKVRIYVSVPDILKTTINKTLPFKHNMKGKAEIITEKKRLIERLFNEIRVAWHKNANNTNP